MPPSSTPHIVIPRLCHPTSPTADCTLAIVLLDEAVTLPQAEAFAAEHAAYLNVIYRVDPVCVTKDFPTMAATDLGQTASRRSYWEAEERMDRIAQARNDGFAPPVTIGGFNVTIDSRMSDEWRLAQQPGVLFDNLGLWIDEAAAARLAGDFAVDSPDHWRYTHSEDLGEIALDRHYEPPSLAAITDPGCVASDG